MKFVRNSVVRFLICAATLVSLGFVTEGFADEKMFHKLAKAVVAAMMSRDPKTIKVENYKMQGVYFVSYTRESDRTNWAFLVKFEGKKAVWAGAGSPSEPNKIGRWRDHPADSVITYEVENNVVTIRERFSENSSIERKFNLDAL